MKNYLKAILKVFISFVVIIFVFETIISLFLYSWKFPYEINGHIYIERTNDNWSLAHWISQDYYKPFRLTPSIVYGNDDWDIDVKVYGMFGKLKKRYKYRYYFNDELIEYCKDNNFMIQNICENAENNKDYEIYLKKTYNSSDELISVVECSEEEYNNPLEYLNH